MTQITQPAAKLRFRKWYLLFLLMPLAASVLCIIGITGYFRLSSETAALRTSLMQSVGGQWHKMIAVHIGGLTSAVARTGLRCVKLAPEPRAAIEALRGAEAGIYRLQPGSRSMERDTILSTADAAMAARGWDRVVGVVKEDQVVLVYLPRKGISETKMKCCFMVLAEDTLVVGSARANLTPLLAIARTRMDLHQSRAARLARPFCSLVSASRLPFLPPEQAGCTALLCGLENTQGGRRDALPYIEGQSR